MLVGPVFSREIILRPRSLRLYLSRAGYVGALFGLVFTAWLILFGSNQVSGLGDLARFSGAVFSVLAPLQLAMALAFSALLTAAAVAQEKDRRTLDLLLMTNLSNVELVLGKLLASMLSVLVMIVAAIPLFVFMTLLGGVSYMQVVRVVAVTLLAAILAGSLGSTLALWRERTFQSLALTALILVLWLMVGELIAAGVFGNSLPGMSAEQWAAALSPLRAIFSALLPFEGRNVPGSIGIAPVNCFLLFSLLAAVFLNLWAIVRVRVWNPTQAAERRTKPEEAAETTTAPLAKKQSREVWDNPILWREMRTWAYGKKIVIVRIAYLAVFAICAAVLWGMITGEDANLTGYGREVPVLARPLVPLVVLGLVLVNALAVTSLTNERDLRALDLLLVTDLSPKEIIFGKLGGIFYNSKEIILLPLLLCGWLWYLGLLSTENLVFLGIATLVMNAFVSVLGVHVGMTYFESRVAVGVSLGTVLFLLLGIAVCMRMMVAFQTSFSQQFFSFFSFMLGGSAGLFFALGRRNPSNAIQLASLITPFATFYVITNFLESNYGGAFLVTVATYGFATAAMLVPAVYEFDVATGRTTMQD